MGSQRKRKSPWDFGRRSRLTFVAAPIARAAHQPAPEAPRRNQRLRFEPTIFPEIGRGKRMGKRRFQPMSGTRLDVCALGDRRGPGGRGDGARPLPSPRLLRREDLASRGNSVRAVIGLSGAALNSKGGRPHVPVSNSRPDRLLDPSVYPRNRSPLVYTPCHSPIEGKWCSSKQVDSRSR